jgi:hypothetical protein
MIGFKRVEAIPLSRSPAKVLIRWETNHPKQSDIANYEFCVLREIGAEDSIPNFQDVDIDQNPKTPLGPSLNSSNLKQISLWIDGLDFPWYVDYTDSLKNLTNISHYKVKCRNKDTQEEVVSSSFTVEGQLDLVGLYICDEHNFLLKDTIGVPSLIFKRRRGGIACKNCFDPIQKKRTISNCTVCYGTNWLGGFFKPLDSYVDFSPNPKTSTITNWGEVQENECNALLSNHPDVAPGDVIRELRDHRMWRVVHVTVTEKRRCQMLQFARLAEIKPGDIEYALATDERFQVEKVSEIEAIKQKPEF